MTQPSRMFQVFVCCYLVFVQVVVILAEFQIKSRIAGGREASIEDVPFLVQIFRDGLFSCGGTRASDRHIITAAHCVYGVSPDRLTVVAGTSTLSGPGIRATVSEVIVSPDYNKRKHIMDIAVMKLKSRLIGPSVGLPSRCEVSINPGDEVQLFGWGRLSERSQSISNQLQTTTVNVIDHTECQLMYKNKVVITESTFCAGSPEKDSCSGDSGGPALLSGQFCGIVAAGYGCARSDFAGLYTMVNHTSTLFFLFDALRK